MIGGARRTRRGGRSRRRGGMKGSQNLALNALLTGMVHSRGKKRNLLQVLFLIFVGG